MSQSRVLQAVALVFAWIFLAGGVSGARAAEALCPAVQPPHLKRLSSALNSRDPQRIDAATQTVRAIHQREIEVPIPIRRRATPPDLKRTISDRELQRIYRRLLNRVRERKWWNAGRVKKPGRRQSSLSDLFFAIETSLVVARNSEALSKKALQTAKDAADYILEISTLIDFPALPMPLAQQKTPATIFARWGQRRIAGIGGCEPNETAAGFGWLVVPGAPELHFQDTALAAEALADLGRVVKDDRYVDWAKQASAWIAKQPIVPTFHVNALPVAMDAELYLATADEVFLARAVERAKFGLISGMILQGKQTGRWVGLDSNGFAERIVSTRALIKAATAAVTSPAGAISTSDRLAIYVAAQKAWRALEADLVDAKGLSLTGLVVETVLDIERAKRAGMPFGVLDARLLKPALAIGVRGLAKGEALGGAGAARLAEALSERSWKGAFRPPRQR